MYDNLKNVTYMKIQVSYKFDRFIIDPASAILISAGIAGGTSILNSVLGGIFQKGSNSNTFSNNKELMALQYGYDVDMWKQQAAFASDEARTQRNAQSVENQMQRNWEEKMVNQQNEWNSPAHQLQMMREAGINPLGQWNQVSSASPNGVSTGGMAEANSPSVGSVGLPSGFEQSVYNPLDVRSVADAAESAARAMDLKADAAKKESERATEDAMRDLKVQETGARIELLIADKELSQQNRRVLVEKEKEVAQTVANLKATYDEIQAKIKEINASTSLARVQKKRLLKELEYFDRDKYMQYRKADDEHNKSIAEVSLMNMQEEEVGEKIHALSIANQAADLDLEVQCAGHEGRIKLVKRENEIQLQVLEVKGAIEGNAVVQWTDKVLSWANSAIDCTMKVVNIADKFLPSKSTTSTSSSTTTYYDKKGNIAGSKVSNDTRHIQ